MDDQSELIPHPLKAAIIEQLADRLLHSGMPVADLQGIVDFTDSWISTRALVPLHSQIKRSRCRSGWTMTRLSHETGISRQNISLWESGAHLPTVDSLQRVSRALKTTFTVFDEDSLKPLHSSAPEGEPVSPAGLSPGSMDG